MPPPGIGNGGGGTPPGNANGGGGIMGCPPGFWPSIGLDADCPSAAYEEVMESMTDWAFSWPISVESEKVVSMFAF
jgi:hypothetical protein